MSYLCYHLCGRVGQRSANMFMVFVAMFREDDRHVDLIEGCLVAPARSMNHSAMVSAFDASTICVR